MMMTSGGLTSARTMRNSPFRESEWDRRLDHLLQDLENSTSSASAQALAAKTATASTVHTNSLRPSFKQHTLPAAISLNLSSYRCSKKINNSLLLSNAVPQLTETITDNKLSCLSKVGTLS